MMIRRKLTYLAGGALAAIALISLMGPTSGGFPSRPTFQAVTVRSADAIQNIVETDAPANEQRYRWVSSAGDLFLGTRTDADGAGANILQVTRTGTTVDSIALGATTIVGTGTMDWNGAADIGDGAGQVLLRARVAGDVALRGTSTGAANISYLAFQNSAGAESAFVGDASAGNSTLTLQNNNSGGALDLVTTGGGAVQVNGSTIWTAANDGVGSGLDADLLDGISSASFLQAAFGVTQANAQRATIICLSGGNCDVTGIAVGQSAIATKEADESRISTTTETADSDLRFVNVPIGVYQVRTFIVTDNTTSTGVKVSLAHPTQVQDIDGIGTNNCNSALTHSIVQSAAAGPQQFLLCTATNDEGTARWEFALETSVSGTVGIVWAQQTSSATATQMRRRSSIELTRIN